MCLYHRGINGKEKHIYIRCATCVFVLKFVFSVLLPPLPPAVPTVLAPPSASGHGAAQTGACDGGGTGSGSSVGAGGGVRLRCGGAGDGNGGARGFRRGVSRGTGGGGRAAKVWYGRRLPRVEINGCCCRTAVVLGVEGIAFPSWVVLSSLRRLVLHSTLLHSHPFISTDVLVEKDSPCA